MKGLVLEGGAMRGMFTAGVLDVFMENGITFDAAVGVSAGATFGCNIKSRQIGRAIRYNKRFAHHYKYGTFLSVLLFGDIYEPKFCYDTLPFKLDLFDLAAYRANPLKFYVTVSNGTTGQAEYHEIPDGGPADLVWMQASASMPMVSKPVMIDGTAYLDGGMTASIPLKFMENLGSEKTVVVLTQPADYEKKPAGMKWLMNLSLRKYPKLITAWQNRHTVYNEEKRYAFAQQDAGSALVLCPKEKLPAGRLEHNVEKLEATYQAGRQVASENLERIKAFLG
ncbi:MAG: patatin family protein [Treponemataceae bacterium]|nr:patatin family protein [Treponemataceae bacterium]